MKLSVSFSLRLLATSFMLFVGIACAQPPVPDGTTDLSAANKALSEKRYAEALTLYQKIEDAVSPTDRVKVVHSIGLCHKSLGQAPDALRSFARATALARDEAAKRPSVTEFVSLLLGGSKWEQAFAAAQQATEGIEVAEATAAYLMVRLAFDGYHWKQRFDDEIAICQRVLATYPAQRESCATAVVSIGSALVRQGKYEEGYAALHKTASDYAEFRKIAATARHRIVYSKASHEQDPRAALQEAIGFVHDFPDQVEPLRSVVSIAVESAFSLRDEPTRRLLEDLAALTTDVPAAAQALVGLGDLYVGATLPEQATQAYNKVLGLNCDRLLKTRAQYGLDEAVSLSLDPTNDEFALSLGLRLLSYRRMDAAANLAKRVLGANRNSVPAQLLLGEVEIARGNLPAAAQVFQAVVKASPQNAEARFALAKVTEQISGQVAAHPYWSEFLKVEPATARAEAVRRGWVALSAPRCLWEIEEDKFASPSYSPDGRLIAAAQRNGARWDIVVIDPPPVHDKRMSIPCADPIAKGYHLPKWTDDGRSILFDVDYGWPQTIMLIADPRASDPPRKLIPQVSRSYNARFHPERTGLIFAGPEQGIWTAGADGGNPKALIAKLPWGEMVGLSSPQWSLDGKWLFCSVSKDRWETYDVYRIDPSNPADYRLIAMGQHQA